jgi:septum site-determining protein MinD
MIKISKDLRPDFVWILLDSPAGIERGFRNAIAAADQVLIVTNPEVSAVRDADRVIGLIEAEEKGPGHLILNRVKMDMVKRGDMLSTDDVLDILAIPLIGIIPEDEGILVSTNRGAPAAMDDRSRAGQAFRNIARRLRGEDVPFLPLEDNRGFLQKLAARFARSGG